MLVPEKLPIVTDDKEKKVEGDAESVSKDSEVEVSLPFQEALVVTSEPLCLASLPSPVPCTASQDQEDDIMHPPQLCRLYPHLDLPPDTPQYLLSSDIFIAKPELLAKMQDMGFTELAASKALYWTGNNCIDIAINWIFQRPENTLKTPLDVELGMLKADLDVKEEEIRERIQSIDSGVCMIDDDEMEYFDDEMDYTSLDYEDIELFKLVLIVNKSFHIRPLDMTTVVGRVTGHMMVKVGMHDQGDEQLDMWEMCGEQVVILEGENSKHLMDLKLAAQCLELQWVEEGRFWDRESRRYRNLVMVGIWGEEEHLNKVVGRLEQFT